MEANEIRIGNWVSFFNPISGKIEYRQVTARFFSSLAGGRSESEMSPDEELNNYWQPIPLTPEILEKCAGFRLDSEALWKSGYNNITRIDRVYCEDIFNLDDRPNMRLDCILDPESKAVRRIGIRDFSYSGNLSGRAGSPFDIRHLHTFQNIYKILTGEELKIEL